LPPRIPRAIDGGEGEDQQCAERFPTIRKQRERYRQRGDAARMDQRQQSPRIEERGQWSVGLPQVRTPPATHTSSTARSEGICAAIALGSRKIPDPMMVPATTATASMSAKSLRKPLGEELLRFDVLESIAFIEAMRLAADDVRVHRDPPASAAARPLCGGIEQQLAYAARALAAMDN
jgi:hypothetical protein